MTHAKLTPDELLAFGGLALWLIRADGQLSEAEGQALEAAAADLFGDETPQATDGPYRTSPVDADDDAPDDAPKENEVLAVLERAQLALPDEEAVRRAARAVTRQEARELIYAVLFDVAASDTISKSEWPLLQWLTTEWNVGEP
jgi:hypothetical protein